MARGLCAMLAPILAFTADEAWEFIPKNGAESIHLATWEPAPFMLDAREEDSWKLLFGLRETVLAHLEKARQAKTIGKALDAKVSLAGPANLLPSTDPEFAALQELLNVSQLAIQRREGDLSVEVAPAGGTKCERCWHYEIDTGANVAHPAICLRCVAALNSLTLSSLSTISGKYISMALRPVAKQLRDMPPA